MKQTRMMIVFMLLIFVFILPLAANSSHITLERSYRFETDKSYICGVLYEDFPVFLLNQPYIYLYLQNIETEATYELRFTRFQRCIYFAIPPGKYRMSSFNMHASLSLGGGFFPFNRKVKKYLTMNVPSDLLTEFEVQQGEVVYIGDYYGRKAMSLEWRTASIHRQYDVEKCRRQIEPEILKQQLSFKVLDLTDISPCMTSFESTSPSGHITGRFTRVLAGGGDYRIVFQNLHTKKTYNIKFLEGQSSLQYLEVEPGQYLVKTIYFSGSARYQSSSMIALIPDALLLPFTVSPGEVLYIGDCGLQEMDKGSKVGLIYVYNFEISREEVREKFGDANNFGGIQVRD